MNPIELGYERGDRQLIKAIARSVTGPILVIGGGTSAIEDLEKLRSAKFEPAAVISANEHGLRQEYFKPTHAVCCDPTHGVKHTKMDRYLGELAPGLPIITPCHFGDYRLPDWKVACNTGLTAIAVAAMMGGAVVPVGFDFYRCGKPGADTYFHTSDADMPKDNRGHVSNSNSKVQDNFDKQIAALVKVLGPFEKVRPLSGPLLEHFKPWDHREKIYGGGPMSTQAEYVMQRDRVIVLVGHKAVPFNMGMAEPGRRFPCSEDEAFRLCNSQVARVVAPNTHPLFGFRKGLKKPVELLPPPPDTWPGLIEND